MICVTLSPVVAGMLCRCTDRGALPLQRPASAANPGDGHTITSVYDGNNLVQQTWYNADGTVANVLKWSYDDDGNLLSASNNAGSYTMTYDGNQLVSETTPSGVTLNYQYDADGNVTQITDSLGDTVTSQYDGGNLVERGFSGPNGQLLLTMSYDANNNLTGINRYSDLAGTQLVGTTTQTYNAVGQITQITHKDGSGNVLASFSYTYGTSGRLISELDNGSTTNYEEDAVLRVIAANSTHYSYDLNGNPTDPGDVIGPDNELLSDGTWNYSYDTNGNLIGKTGVSNGLTWTYTYDVGNEMIGATETNSQGQTLVNDVFTYDVFGHLASSSISLNGGTAVASNFVYNGDELWAQLNGPNQSPTVYISGDQPDQFFAQVSASAGVSWLLDDHLGTPRVITNAAGQSTGTNNYDTYGNVINMANPAQDATIGYAGSVYQLSTGLNYDWHRWYNSQTGQWQTEDPLGLKPGPNPYEYVNDAPTNAIDPTGEDGIAPQNPVINPPSTIQGTIAENEKSSESEKADSAYNSGYVAALWGIIDYTVVYSMPAAQSAAYLKGFEDAKAGRTSSPPSRPSQQEIAGMVGPLLSDSGRATLRAFVNRATPSESSSYVAPGHPDYIGKTWGGLNVVSAVTYVGLLGTGQAGSAQLLRSLNGGQRNPTGEEWARWANANYGDTSQAPPPFLIWAHQIQTELPSEWLTATRLSIDAMYTSIPYAGQVYAASQSGVAAASSIAQGIQNPELFANRNFTRSLDIQVGVTFLAVASMIPEEGAVSRNMSELSPARNARRLSTDGVNATRSACFVAGTPLLTPDGSKYIEEFRPGDLVLSRSEFDLEGPVVAKLVEEVFIGTATVLELLVNGRVIGTTAEHPFYVLGRGWRPAKELRIGDQFVSDKGVPIAVEAIRDTGLETTVYNLRIADYHTYFVGSREWGFSVWAHNLCYQEWLTRYGLQDTPELQQLFQNAVTRRLTPESEQLLQQLMRSKGVRDIGRAWKDLQAVQLENLPKGRPLTESDLPLLKRYLSLKPGEPGGRWGSIDVRKLNHAKASELEAQGYKIEGAGRSSEEHWGIGTAEETYVDIKATKDGQKTIRIQTVDTYGDGHTLKPNEAAAAARIKAKFPNDELRLISKQTGEEIPYP